MLVLIRILCVCSGCVSFCLVLNIERISQSVIHVLYLWISKVISLAKSNARDV